MEYRDKDFDGQDVLLDGNTFSGCTFQNCRMIFRGTKGPKLSANHFKQNVQWSFDGPAGLTLQFMSAFYNGRGEGGKEMIEALFEQIRRGWE